MAEDRGVNISEVERERLVELWVKTTRAEPLTPPQYRDWISLNKKLKESEPDDPNMKRLKDILIWLKFSPDADK